MPYRRLFERVFFKYFKTIIFLTILALQSHTAARVRLRFGPLTFFGAGDLKSASSHLPDITCILVSINWLINLIKRLVKINLVPPVPL